MPNLLSSTEEKLLNALCRLEKYDRASVAVTGRMSAREGDFEFAVPAGGQVPCRMIVWLLLGFIRAAQGVANQAQFESLCALSDYPEMAFAGDWSAFRDSRREAIWGMFELCRTFVCPPSADSVPTVGQIAEALLRGGPLQCGDTKFRAVDSLARSEVSVLGFFVTGMTEEGLERTAFIQSRVSN